MESTQRYTHDRPVAILFDATAGLEFAVSAAINASRSDTPLHTTSLRVTFLQPFLAGAESRYEETTLRVGRSTGVGDAHAIGADGKVATALYHHVEDKDELLRLVEDVVIGRIELPEPDDGDWREQFTSISMAVVEELLEVPGPSSVLQSAKMLPNAR